MGPNSTVAKPDAAYFSGAFKSAEKLSASGSAFGLGKKVKFRSFAEKDGQSVRVGFWFGPKVQL